MKPVRIVFLVGLLGLAACLAAGPANAQSWSPDTRPGAYPSPMRKMTGLVSGYEAWQLHDMRRQAELGRQVDLNADMYWRWSGVSSYYPGWFEAWPMVPGSIWGWPAAVSPPTVSSTRVPPQFDPEFAEATAVNPPSPTAKAPAEGLPTSPPNFAPAPEFSAPKNSLPTAPRALPPAGKAPSTRRQPYGPRNF